MKSYKEIADSVLKRRDEYFKAKKRRRALIIKTASSVMGTAAAAVIGFMIYNNTILQDIKPDRYGSRYTTTEAVATAPSHPETNETVTTQVCRPESEHSHARTEKTSATTTAPEETKSATTKETIPEETRSATSKKTTPVTETDPPTFKTTSIQNKPTSPVQTHIATTIVSLPFTHLTALPSTTESHHGGGTGAPPMETDPPVMDTAPVETYATTVISTYPQIPMGTGSIPLSTVTTSPFLTGSFVTSATMTFATTTTTTTTVTATAFPDTETTTTPIEEEIPSAPQVIYYDDKFMSGAT
ncbi:MAG: hypothetical protein J6B75_08760 [Ruminococcus sp.]|nr:hypothetical protein [Ruminococcus sp.]